MKPSGRRRRYVEVLRTMAAIGYLYPLATWLMDGFIKQNVDPIIGKCSLAPLYAETGEVDKKELPLFLIRLSSDFTKKSKIMGERERFEHGKDKK